MPINLVSFSAAEIDTIIVRQFEKGTNFQTLKDTLLAGSTNFYNIKIGVDTTQLATGGSFGHITSTYNYEIYIPSLNSLSKISDVKQEMKEGSCGRCINFVTSYTKDGQTYKESHLFIKK
jgi:hypothetical protein